MAISTRTPGPVLRQFVELLWLADGPSGHGLERVLPTGTVELVISLRDESMRVHGRDDVCQISGLGGAVVSGTQAGYFVIDAAQQESLIGVHFRPGGAAAVLGLPASELHDRHKSLESIWGADTGRLRERILESSTPAAKLRTLEAALAARLTHSLARASGAHPAVAFAIRQFNSGLAQPIAHVTRRLGLSPRRFIELFSRQVGMTPKLYCRIQRFQRTLDRIERTGSCGVNGDGRAIDWPAIALACGYYDQAHMIRDFRQFSGLTPTAYAARRTAHRNHVPM